MTDDARILVLTLVFLYKLQCTRECYLIDIAVYFLFTHTKTVVRYGESLFFLVYLNVDPVIAVGGRLVQGHQSLHLGHGVASVGDKLTEEYLLVGIQPSLNYREYMLGFDGNTAFFLFVHH